VTARHASRPCAFLITLLVIAAAGCGGDNEAFNGANDTLVPTETSSNTAPQGGTKESASSDVTATTLSAGTTTKLPEQPTTIPEEPTTVTATTNLPEEPTTVLTTPLAQLPTLSIGKPRLRREVAGGQNCVLEIPVMNEGPGNGRQVEVTVVIENLRGPGAPDHVTYGPAMMRGPSQLDAGKRGTYVLQGGLTMKQGDVWRYRGSISAADIEDMAFDDGGTAIPCSS
jgi:hypothetical protein